MLAIYFGFYSIGLVKPTGLKLGLGRRVRGGCLMAFGVAFQCSGGFRAHD